MKENRLQDVITPNGIRTVQDLVKMAKATSITFGSTGVGGPVYLTMERFRDERIPARGA